VARDRLAVTDVVAKMGQAQNSESALRVALDAVRTAFGWAYGSYWEIDTAGNVLKFKVESGSAGEEFRKVTWRRPSPTGWAFPAGPGVPTTWCRPLPPGIPLQRGPRG